MRFEEQYPYGSARFAQPLEIHSAFKAKGGVPFGFYNGRKLFHAKNAGMLLIGGAGSGKFTSILAHIMDAPGRGGEPARYAIFDPKRELRAVLEPYFASIKARVYEINPYFTHGVQGNRLSLLSHLTPDSPRLVADSRRAARTFLPESGGGDSAFFDQKGQIWLDALIRGLTHTADGVSPTKLFNLIGTIRSKPDEWELMAEMIAGGGSEPDLRTTYDEMLDMAADSRRTFDSVMGGVTNALAFMNDPRLQSAFTSTHSADFTLDVLCEDSPDPVFVFFVMPPEMIEQNAAVIRQFFSTLRTLKQMRPEAPTLNLVIDEAAQLGRFPEIAEFYSIGRGFGLCPVCVYQDIGQIRNNLGPTGAMTLSASADIEVYLGGGISDLETARHLSAKLGNQTLELEDHLTQHRAQRAMREAMHDALFGRGSAMRTGLAMKTLDYERGHKRKQARALMTPEEILGMSHKQSLVLASGYGIPPFLADKNPYFAMPRYTGLYGPNPYFDRDLGVVKVPGRFRSKRSLRVITEAVPPALADLPQYQNGVWSFIEGHRPKV